MHKHLIKEATHEQLKDFVSEALSMIKETHHDLYEDLELYLYKEMYGCHFTDWLLHKATDAMCNEDGSTGAHYSLEQTTSFARQHGITFDKFNEYDWNYVMNMIYSDYYGAVPNDMNVYVKMAKKFICDKDAPHDKAFKYYFSMQH